MRIGLWDCDATGFPNLALMKLSAAYKRAGHIVEWYNTEKLYDKVVASSVFTFTDKPKLPHDAIIGGTGFGVTTNLPEEVELLCPDYDIYSVDTSYGFLTRGCSRSCNWCVVPVKEGPIRKAQDFRDFVKHNKAIFMDNNVLAHDHGIDQISQLAHTGIKVDFNQGLDARLIDDGVARRLSKLKWLSPVRLACDSGNMIPHIRKAVELLRWHNCSPRTYFCYVLAKDVDETLERLKFLKGLGVDAFCQPYRDFQTNEEPSRELRRLARWVNTKQLFKSVSWEDYCFDRGHRI